jgi:hypothetical protein
LDDVKNYLKIMYIRDWRNTARERDAWEFILKEAKVLHRP